MRLLILLLLLFSSFTLGLRYTGFDRYQLVEGDVIFNPYNEQLRIHKMNSTNQSLTLQFVSAAGASSYDTVAVGKEIEYNGECVILHGLKDLGPYWRIDLSWSPNSCIRKDAPTPAYLRVTRVGFNDAFLQWESNVASNATVLFRTQNTTEKESSISVFSLEHQLRLQNLRPGTPYFFRVKSCGQGNYSNCTWSSNRTFRTLPGTEFNAQEGAKAEYPIHKGTPLRLQGFEMELADTSPGRTAFSLVFEGENLCLQRPEACILTARAENRAFLETTGMHAELKEVTADTAMVSFSLSPNTRFPPAIIWRPSTRTIQTGQKTTVEVVLYDVNPEGKITGANATYADGNESKRIVLQEGKNVVEVSFSAAGTHAFRIEAINKAGIVANVSKTIFATKPETPAPTPFITKTKKNATATSTPTGTVSVIEQVRQKLATQGKPFNIWDYSLYGIFAAGLVIVGVIIYLFVLRKKPGKP